MFKATTPKRRSYFIVLLIFTLLILTACISQPATESIMPTPSDTFESLQPTTAAAPTLTPTLMASLTPTPTIESYVTAIAIEKEDVLNAETPDQKQTQIAEFSIDCEQMDEYTNTSRISPDGNWLAVTCGYKRGMLIVKSKSGTKWVLDFKNFLSPEGPQEIPGSLIPKFWSPEGNYLFFITTLGYSGGGNFCFPEERGDYGLFRLNLSTGSWSTLIPPTDFPGYEIEFSPTGRRYAITYDGLMITDFRTSKVTKISVDGVIEKLLWSSDGTHLAYSVARCDDDSIIASSVYIWDSATDEAQILFKRDHIILKPEVWINSSKLKMIGAELYYFNFLYTIYEFDTETKNLLFTETATPYR